MANAQRGKSANGDQQTTYSKMTPTAKVKHGKVEIAK
jgi:hypothetical protein